MRGKVWTLTQTEDTLWYYVYSHQINTGTENRQKWKVEEEEQLLGKMSKRKTDLKQEEAGLCTVMSEPDNCSYNDKAFSFGVAPSSSRWIRSSAINERNVCSSSTDNDTAILWLMQKCAFV